MTVGNKSHFDNTFMHWFNLHVCLEPPKHAKKKYKWKRMWFSHVCLFFRCVPFFDHLAYKQFLAWNWLSFWERWSQGVSKWRENCLVLTWRNAKTCVPWDSWICDWICLPEICGNVPETCRKFREWFSQVLFMFLNVVVHLESEKTSKVGSCHI